ncbi:cuticle protein 8-like [Penaeus vannamei]|uniref:cuticle protein 8-like n=1 Tax=Penaeus vannamei TaxID=6689 RepID=UPI00387F3D8B
MSIQTRVWRRLVRRSHDRLTIKVWGVVSPASQALPLQQLNMFNKGVLLLALVGVALAAPSDPYHQPSYKEEPKPYQFAYGVKDEYAGTDFGQSEESDGHAVKGSYTVQLPDGRKQTVNYVADHYNGYQAEVSYYGEAQYPHQYGPPVTFKPQGYHPQPSYH